MPARVDPEPPASMVAVVVRADSEPPSVRFEPLRPVSRARLILRLVYGPVLWLVAFAIAALLFLSGWVIQVALVVTAASFLVGLVVLAVLRMGRQREAGRYVAGD
jgi:hypothetical protein